MRRCLIAGALGALVACAKPAPVPMPHVTFTATDYKIAGPDTLPGGLVAIHFVSNGTEPHQAQFARLNDGVSYAKADSAVQAMIAGAAKEGPAAFQHLLAIGAPVGGGGPSLSPGKSADVVVDLPSGNYMVFCFLPSPDGVPHFMKGMMKRLIVLPPAAQQPAAPVADAMVSVTDFAFDSFPTLKAGKTVLEVRNHGKEPHEFAVLQLKGITAQQAVAMLTAPPPPPPAPAKSKAGRGRGAATPPAPAGPPPFDFVGGMQAILPGAHGWTTLDLTPGNYVVVCFVPSPANQFKDHVSMGMMKPFTIS